LVRLPSASACTAAAAPLQALPPPLLNWWMPPGRDPGRSYQPRDRVIQLQGDHGRPPARRLALHLCPIRTPPEVSPPRLLTRIEQAHPLPRHRTPAVHLGARIAVAQPAGQPQVLLVVTTAARRRDNVLDVQYAEHIALRTAAVAAAVTRLGSHPGADIVRNGGAHGLSGSRKPRCTASRNAWALRKSPSW
jgi:hypothetical protein